MLQLLVLVAFVTPNALHYSSAQQAFSTQGERSKTDAFACIAEALALDSLSAATRYQLGRLYEIYGDTALAIEQYNRALHLDTSYVSCSDHLPSRSCSLSLIPVPFVGGVARCSHEPTLLRMAFINQTHQNDTQSAERLLTSIVRRNPANHNAWFQLGTILQERNQDEQAAECLATALALEDTSPILPFSILPIEI